MRRALITTIGLAAVAAAAVPVLAAPAPVDHGRTAGVQVSTKLPSGETLQLDISASELSSGPELVIDTERCDSDGTGCVTKTYAGALPADALTISASDPQARLETTLDGRPLLITWKPQANGGYSVGAGTLEGDGPDTFANEYAGTSADVNVLYDDAGCQGVGGVGDGVVVDTSSVSGSQTARPLSTLNLPDGTTLHC